MIKKYIGFGVLWAVIASSGLADRSPNFLFIISDDQSPRAIGSSGNNVIQTPHLDRLAKDGICFTHGYNMGSYSGAICVASRAMLNTGRHVWQARDAVETDTFWSEHFQAAGYDTFLTGKWHVESDGLNEEQTAVKAFESAQAMGKGFYESIGQYNRPASNPDWAPDDRSLPGHWMPEVWNITNRVISAPYTVEKHTSELYADEAISYLNARTEQSEPFFMYVSFNAPHDPRQAPTEYQEMYSSFDPPIPPNLWGEYPYELKAQRDDGVTSYPVTEDVYKLHLKEYYAMISHMDAQVGRILAVLEASGEADNTYVIFTSDHGLSVGEHGYIGKQILYDHSARVPFLMKGPGIEAGSQTDAMFYFQSIVPTTLELAGIPVPDEVDFPSLTGLMNGTTNKLYDSLYGGLFVTGDRPQRMIRNDKYKLIMYPYLEEYVLYDLEADPWETINLLEQSTYGQTANDLYAQYQTWHTELDDPHVMPFIDFSSVHVDDAKTDRIVYSGDWTHARRDVSVKDTISYTTELGASAELTFDGVDVRVYTQHGAGAGVFEIYLDDVLVETYDSYAPVQTDQVLAFERRNLAPGTHVIRIVNAGRGQGGVNVHVDMMTYNRTGVRPAGLTDRTDEADTTVTAQHPGTFPETGPDQLFDNNADTKYVTSNSTCWVKQQFGGGDQYAVRWYSLTSAQDDPPPPPDELVTNGSFEDGTRGWLVSSPQEATVSNDTAVDGDHSLKLARIEGGAVDPTSQHITVQPNTEYTLRYSFNRATKTKGAFVVTVDPGSLVRHVNYNPTGGWLDKEFAFNSGGLSQVTLKTYADGSITDTVYVDNFSLTETQLPVGASDKDPASWTLSGSDDGTNWTVVDRRSNVEFTERGQTLEFDVQYAYDDVGIRNPYDMWASGGGGYGFEYYRLNATNSGGSALHLAEVEYFGNRCEGGASTPPKVTGAPHEDDDGDGRDNFYEYVMNGDPNDGGNGGVDPTLINAGNLFQYTHVQRTDDPYLIYTLESCTNLVSGKWTPANSTQSTSVSGEVFNEVSHTFQTDQPQTYIRLKMGYE